MAHLWLKLTEIYGPLFVNRHGVKDSGVWYEALCDLTENDIKFGLWALFRAKEHKDWPPSCLQFRHLCLSKQEPEANGLPTVHAAFYEARRNLSFSKAQWSHPAIKFTVKILGIDKVNAARADLAFAEFKPMYLKVCAEISLGKDVPFVADDELVIRKKNTTKIPHLAQLMKELA